MNNLEQLITEQAQTALRRGVDVEYDETNCKVSVIFCKRLMTFEMSPAFAKLFKKAVDLNVEALPNVDRKTIELAVVSRSPYFTHTII